MKPGAVIIGASHAGTQAAAALRQSGWQDPITLISNEDGLPYHRPPLSKGFLSGQQAEDQILLRGEGFYRDQDIALLNGSEVTQILPERQQIETGGAMLPYAALVLATGASARKLSIEGSSLENVHMLRSLADSRLLKERLAAAGKIVIIGGGFIGLEVAATAAKAGKAVTVVEAQDRLIARALPPFLSAYFRDLHAGNGVAFRLNTRLDRFKQEGGRVSHVHLADGEKLAADLVLVGVGSDANCSLARQAGLEIAAGGILVDSCCKTSAPSIYAIGDCAAQFNDHTQTVMRVESVQNATDQARILAAHLTGKPLPAKGANWFWSDQYSAKLQMAGIMLDGCDFVLRGDPQSGDFTLLQMMDDRLAAAFSVNRAGDHMAARKLIASSAMLDRAMAADPAAPLVKAVVEMEKA
ncbi:MAG TPA: FAD-dependent oxidoreductase [Rhizobiaceae bacterium]|nr:FAD-dependent oxidoreductase [Rhizobiaceae bacterium]